MNTKDTVGVLVARFQGHKLHAGWRGIIDTVRARHARVLIVLGVHGGVRTKRDPLTYEEREQMVREAYPDSTLTIRALRDHPFSNDRWSRNLDALIIETGAADARLYGSRDSFIPKYRGRFPTESITPTVKYSGTELRSSIVLPRTEDALAGIIHAVMTRPDILYSTVDIAIADKKNRKILLIGKPVFEEFLAFPGGFAEPTGESDMHDAIRERCEEVLGIETGNFLELGRVQMRDPRYRDSTDGTRTTLFLTEYKGGTPAPGDDAASIEWVDYEKVRGRLVPWHLPLEAMVRQALRY